MGDNTKQCANCKEFKTFDLYHTSKTGRMGLYNYCKQCASVLKKKYVKENADYIKQYKKRPEIVARRVEISKNRYRNDSEYREKLLERNRIRRRKNKFKEQERFRFRTDIEYRLTLTLRSRVRHAIKKVKMELNIEVGKCAKTVELLGCSLLELKIYIEKQFKPGMTWENHGYGEHCWHIDHILPCDSFDLTQEEEQRKCFHYSNLQPLWQKDNLLKSNKI